MLDSVRTRLTLWNVGVLSVALLAFSWGVYALTKRTLSERLDSGLRATLETTISELSDQSAAQPIDLALIKESLAELHFPGQYVGVMDEQGRTVVENISGGVAPLRLPPRPFGSGEVPQIYQWPQTTPEGGSSCRGVYRRLPGTPAGTVYYVVVTQSLRAVMGPLEVLEGSFAAAAVLAVLLAGVGGWFLTRRALAPVAAMAESAQRITAENLEERLPVGNPRDELGRLASVFNALLGRLGASFAQQRQFMADASHELRTPVSVMRTASQVTLEKSQRDESEYRDALSIIEQQTQRLSRIVEDMFTLARADSGGIAVEATELYLDELLADATRTAKVLAARKGISLEMLPMSEAPFRGDEGLLRRMLMNLLDNAIKYTPAGGTVKTALEARDNNYLVSISDTGVGIPREAQAHIFERFFRADKARTQTAEGSGAGLGLAIARWITTVHQGRLELMHSDGSGTTFLVTLPQSGGGKGLTSQH